MNTTFLVGNGAIEGGWQPVKRAICQTFGKSIDRDPNFAFANLNFQLRWLKYQTQKGNDDAVDAFDKRYQTYETLKKNICEEIVNASLNGLMQVRDKFNQALQRWAQGYTCIATTNWDLLFEPYFSNEQINQIIYGLSLSPLDVELGLVINDGFYNTLLPEKMMVIDCNPDLVVERLKYLGVKNPPDCYRPEDI